MTGRVSAFLPVVGDHDVLRERFSGDPGAWLPAARACGPERWNVAVRYRGLTRPVEAHLGGLWRVGSTQWRSLTWRPVPGDGDVAALDRLLPTLAAELGLYTRNGDASLVVTGIYEPPGARLGELADVVLLHRVAERTAAAFLADIAPLLGQVPVTA
ncbi:MAG: hypothetical protein KY461_14060 [Actinobacteria bacterium]|nr:hypothetical protein [Actinomycetota bacterium]